MIFWRRSAFTGTVVTLPRCGAGALGSVFFVLPDETCAVYVVGHGLAGDMSMGTFTSAVLPDHMSACCRIRVPVCSSSVECVCVTVFTLTYVISPVDLALAPGFGPGASRGRKLYTSLLCVNADRTAHMCVCPVDRSCTPGRRPGTRRLRNLKDLVSTSS